MNAGQVLRRPAKVACSHEQKANFDNRGGNGERHGRHREPGESGRAGANNGEDAERREESSRAQHGSGDRKRAPPLGCQPLMKFQAWATVAKAGWFVAGRGVGNGGTSESLER